MFEAVNALLIHPVWYSLFLLIKALNTAATRSTFIL